MESLLNDTMNNAKHAAANARESAEHAYDAAKHGTDRAVRSARSGVMDALHVMTDVIGMLRRLDTDDALGWVGLARRRSLITPVLTFGAGLVVGTGVGMLMAPSAGVELRRELVRRFVGLKEDAKGAISKEVEKVEKTAEKVEKTAEKAVEKTVEKVEKTAEKAVEKVVSAMPKTNGNGGSSPSIPHA